MWGENHMARSVGSQGLIRVRLIAQFSFQRAPFFNKRPTSSTSSLAAGQDGAVAQLVER